jgi:tetratricopeptide (TPR) repeat protein
MQFRVNLHTLPFAKRFSVAFAIIAGLIVFPLCSPRAQGVGSSRGPATAAGESNVITGKIIFPGAQPENKRIRVKLDSANAVSSSTQSDDDGSFRFNGLPAGQYTITVDAGTNYDLAIESVSIDREASLNGARILSVPIYLRPRGAAEAMFAGVPKDAADLYKKAAQSEAAKDNKKAIEQLNAAIAIDANFGAAQAELGTLYLKMHQVDKAVDALTLAVAIQPKDFSSQSTLGIALLNKKSFVDAETHLRAALAINSAAPTTHMYLGIALLSLSKDEKTKQFNPDKYAEAQTELETATTTGKEEVALAHRYLGGIYWGNKEYKKAADQFELYLKANPKAEDAEKLKGAIKDLRQKG